MDEFLSDHERAEQLKKWWAENYKAILAGIVVAAAILAGWRWWQHRVESRSLAASAQYAQLDGLLSSGRGPEAVALGNKLMSGYGDTPYAALAALTLAKYEVLSGRPDDAMQMLDWVIQHGKDASLKRLARLRLAEIKLAVGDPQAALKILAVASPGGFAPLYAELRGDAYAKLGEFAEARAAYRQALAEWTPDMGDKSLVRMKLDDLRRAPAPATHAGAPRQ